MSKKATWVGPGVFGADILPGQPLPTDVDPGTLEKLIAAGKAVMGDLPVQSIVADELNTVKGQLIEARETAEGWKNIAGTNANAHGELMIAHREQGESLAVSQAAVNELTDQLAAAQQIIHDLTAASLAGAGPKKVEKPK